MAISARASHSFPLMGADFSAVNKSAVSAFSFADPCLLLPQAAFIASAQAETPPKGCMNENYSYLCDIK
jgi:hypothetical protein